MPFGEKILAYQKEMLQDIHELLQIRSVSATDKQAASQALEWILARAERMGFRTKNIQGIAGHVEYGDGKELAAVLAHVDVVPAGEGWSVEPYALTEKDGRLYGRGLVDDKGAAVVALYCLKALKDNGIIPQRRIRLIFGAAEEIGMHDMEVYFAEEEMPAMAFTPDSEYGICCCEKGILQLEISAPANDSTILPSFHAGTAVNAVPAKAEAVLDKETLSIVGKAAHASTPELGINAAAQLIQSLPETSLNSLCRFLHDTIGMETDGRSLGIACLDEPSGALTVNLGKVAIDDQHCHAYLDIRYPVTADFTMLLKTVGKKAAPYGLKVGLHSHEAPLFVERDAPVIKILQKAYQAVTGTEANLYATGGGTYARTLKNNGVAFGPVFADDPAHIHDTDESMKKTNFLLHAQICLEAIYGLAT